MDNETLINNTKFEVITLLLATDLQGANEVGRNTKGISALDELVPLLDKLQYSVLLDYGNGTEYYLTTKENSNE